MSNILHLNTPSNELALQIINKQNGTALLFGEVTLSDAVKLTDSASNRNSSVTVISLPGGVYFGNVPVEYDRFNLAELIKEPVLYVTGAVYPLKTAVETLNSYCGLALTEEELSMEAYTDDGEASLNVGDSFIFLENTPFKIMDEFDRFRHVLWDFTNNALPTATNQI